MVQVKIIKQKNLSITPQYMNDKTYNLYIIYFNFNGTKYMNRYGEEMYIPVKDMFFLEGELYLLAKEAWDSHLNNDEDLLDLHL
jgi:hypothetical protein